MNILLIEDDIDTASFIMDGLKKEGFTLTHISSGLDGLFEILNNSYDLLIVDVMLPELDGISIIKKMREKKINTPVIVLSAKNTTEDIVAGLRAGSDDYISKPFSFIELLTRIKTIFRRINISFEENNVIEEGGVRLNVLKKKVYINDKEIELQAKEFLLLEYLMHNKGHVVTKEMILDHVWNYDFDPSTNIVEAKICKLRNKIAKYYDKKLIHTIKGLGYVFESK